MLATLVLPMAFAVIVITLGLLGLADELAQNSPKPMLAFIVWFLGLVAIVISPIISLIVLMRAGLIVF